MGETIFILIFAFARINDEDVVLLRLKNSGWQYGRWNGLGGKLLHDVDRTPGEANSVADWATPECFAAARLFEKETGVTIPPSQFHTRATINYPNCALKLVLLDLQDPSLVATGELEDKFTEPFNRWFTNDDLFALVNEDLVDQEERGISKMIEGGPTDRVGHQFVASTFEFIEMLRSTRKWWDDMEALLNVPFTTLPISGFSGKES